MVRIIGPHPSDLGSSTGCGIMQKPNLSTHNDTLEPTNSSPFTTSNSNCRKTPQEALAHGVLVSHPLRTRKALGSIPSVSISARDISPHKSEIPKTKQSNDRQHWWDPQVGSMHLCANDSPPSSVGRAQGP